MDSFHISAGSYTTDFFKMSVKETIELSGYYDLVKTSYRRYYNTIHPLLNESYREKLKDIPHYDKNFDELEISVIDRITFLFYYNLIQSVLESGYAMMVISKILKNKEFKNKEKKLTDKEISQLILKSNQIEYKTMIRNDLQLSHEITKKKKKIIQLISSNKVITKIIQDNLKNLKEYRSNDNDFDKISSMLLKN